MRYNSSSVRPKRGEGLSSLLFALLVLPLLLEEEEERYAKAWSLAAARISHEGGPRRLPPKRVNLQRPSRHWALSPA
jgi:hypothetical protein